jgi:hypothetical protein
MQMLTAHQRRKHYSQEQGLRWLIDIAKGLKYLHTSRPMARTLLLVPVLHARGTEKFSLRCSMSLCRWCGEMASWRTSSCAVSPPNQYNYGAEHLWGLHRL